MVYKKSITPEKEMTSMKKEHLCICRYSSSRYYICRYRCACCVYISNRLENSMRCQMLKKREVDEQKSENMKLKHLQWSDSMS